MAHGGDEEVSASEGGDDFEARLAYRCSQKKLRRGREDEGGGLAGEEGKLNGINPRTRKRNRRYFCGSEYRLLPCYSQRARVGAGAAPSSPPARGSSRLSYSAIPLEEPIISRPDPATQSEKGAFQAGTFRRSPRICLRLFLFLAAGAAAYLAQAESTCGEGRMGTIGFFADDSARVEGRRGNFTTFSADSDVPALLRKGVFGALDGELDGYQNWRLRMGNRACARHYDLARPAIMP